jgi:hypothetical protein
MERRMKKILFILTFLGFASYAQACFCALSVAAAFTQLSTQVSTDIAAQTVAVALLVQEVKKNTSDIKEQNDVLEKIIDAEKRRAVQNMEIVFLLKKISELKTAGEL